MTQKRGWKVNLKQKRRIKSLVEVFCVKAQTPVSIPQKVTTMEHEVKT